LQKGRDSGPFFIILDIMSNNKKVLVAVSGGVDSSVALMLLREQGYEVAAANMKLWDYSEVGGDSHQDGRCCSLEAINDLRSICTSRDIPFYVLDFTKEFKDTVIVNFVDEYKNGRTPNPCVLCNTHLKWENLLTKARQIGFDYIATGHYSQIAFDEVLGRYQIIKGVDDTRDQSYALYGLTQEALSRTLLPLGGYHKSEIREFAQKYDLKNASAPESMEICFVADNDYHRFLKEWEGGRDLELKSGDILNSDGIKIGEHQGVPFYTIGQRRGLGISNPTPLYVNDIDPEKNTITVGDNGELLQSKMIVRNINWISVTPPNADFSANVKIRYNHKAAPAVIKPLDDNRVEVIFKDKQRAITPGQSSVFYDGDRVLAGGVIEKSKN